MFKLLFWSPTLPQLPGIIFKEAKRISPASLLCLQIGAQDKTIEFSDVASDEVLRSDPADFSVVQKWVSKHGEKKSFVIIDMWGLIFSPQFDQVLAAIPSLLEEKCEIVFLTPRPWTGMWQHHELTKKLDKRDKEIFSELFSRSKAIFEAVWNTRGNASLVTSAPTFSLLETLSGRVGLNHHTFIGLRFLPRDCIDYRGRFSNSGILAKEVLKRLGIIDPNVKIDRTKWAVNSEPAVAYQGGQMASLDSVLDTKNPRLTFAMSWSRYSRASNSWHQETKFDGAAMLRWLYLLSVLECDESKLAQESKTLANNLFANDATNPL